MARVAEILAAKGGTVHRVAPDTTAHAAIAVMVGNGVGSLLVTEGDDVVGIFTERDYLRRVLLQDRDGRTTLVRDVMTPGPHTLRPEALAVEAVELMERHKVNQLLVVDASGALVGALNMHDLFRAKVV